MATGLEPCRGQLRGPKREMANGLALSVGRKRHALPHRAALRQVSWEAVGRAVMPSAPPSVQKELNRAPFLAFCVARSSRIWLEFVKKAWERVLHSFRSPAQQQARTTLSAFEPLHGFILEGGRGGTGRHTGLKILRG